MSPQSRDGRRWHPRVDSRSPLCRPYRARGILRRRVSTIVPLPRGRGRESRSEFQSEGSWPELPRSRGEVAGERCRPERDPRPNWYRGQQSALRARLWGVSACTAVALPACPLCSYAPCAQRRKRVSLGLTACLSSRAPGDRPRIRYRPLGRDHGVTLHQPRGTPNDTTSISH